VRNGNTSVQAGDIIAVDERLPGVTFRERTTQVKIFEFDTGFELRKNFLYHQASIGREQVLSILDKRDSSLFCSIAHTTSKIMPINITGLDTAI
jgi:hypothetical protein